MKCLGLVPPSLSKRNSSDVMNKKSTDLNSSVCEFEERKVKQRLEKLRRKKTEIKHYQSEFNLSSISTNSKHLNAKARRMSTTEIPVRIKNGPMASKAKRKYSLDSSSIHMLKNQHEQMISLGTNKKPDLVVIKEDLKTDHCRIDSINQPNTLIPKASTNLLLSARSNLSIKTSTIQSSSNAKNANCNFLPKLRKKSSSHKADDKKARGQIELNQLDIPTVYRHSNAAFERYKSNPEFYLPDGTIRRKYSLPKLSEALEQVKNFKYLRRYSIDFDKHVDTSNIFKDNESDEDCSTSSDFSNE